MKISFKYFFIIAFAATIFSCKKDNYDPPSITLSGALLYQGDTIYVERNQVPFQLYQFGFGRVGPIDGTFAQNGTYSTSLFSGDYKLLIPNGQGPFIWKQTASGAPDSISLSIKSNQTVDFEVTPYYMVRSQQYTPTGRNLKFTFNAQKIITDANAKDIERVNVYVNKTQFVSGSSQIASREYSADAILDQSNIEFYKFISPQTPTLDSFFVRIGIKIAGVEDMIFSPLTRVGLGPIDSYSRIEAEAVTKVGTVNDSTIGGATFVRDIDAVGDGIDVPFTVTTAGTYVINIGGATDVKGSTQTVYIDGNAAAPQTPWYPKQGYSNFDISPVQFQLSSGAHTLSIRKEANDVGQVQLDWIDIFRLAQ